VDGHGRLLKLVLTPGQASDYRHGFELVQQAIAHQSQAVMGDKGYDGNALRDQIKAAGLEPIIPFRKRRRIQPEVDRESYKQRNIIERFIGRLKENRRVATRACF
jgi:transposase